MAFTRPANNKQLTFAEVSLKTKLPEDEIELLVMRALSLGLVKGSIDQIDKKIYLRWVQPRVLDLTQVRLSPPDLAAKPFWSLIPALFFTLDQDDARPIGHLVKRGQQTDRSSSIECPGNPYISPLLEPTSHPSSSSSSRPIFHLLNRLFIFL